MHITALILILFTSLTEIVSAMDDGGEAEGLSSPYTNSSKSGEDSGTFDSFAKKWLPIIAQREEENRNLKQQLILSLSMHSKSSLLASNLISEDSNPKEFVINQDLLHCLPQETAVDFVRRTHGYLSASILGILRKLEQEYHVLKFQLAEFEKEVVSAREHLSLKIDTDDFLVPVELRLPPVPDDKPEKERSQCLFEGKSFLLYNVSGFETDCAFFVTDLLREYVIKKLNVPPHLSGELSYLMEGKSISPAFLPHIGEQLLKANIRVLIGHPGYELVVDDVAKKEYEIVKKDEWPTFYVFYDGCGGHYQILAPINDSIQWRLFRRYARKKEDLRIEGINGLDNPKQVHIEPARDEATYLNHLEMAIQASLQDDKIYAILAALQFLNEGRGGWSQDYVTWVKCLQGK